MDSRDYLDADGWPVIPERDRLPLLWLLEGSARTAEFEKRLRDVASYSCTKNLRQEIRQEREAVAYELTLPSWWHFMKSRRFSDGKQMKSSMGMGTCQSGTTRPSTGRSSHFCTSTTQNLSFYKHRWGYFKLETPSHSRPAANSFCNGCWILRPRNEPTCTRGY